MTYFNHGHDLNHTHNTVRNDTVNSGYLIENNQLVLIVGRASLQDSAIDSNGTAILKRLYNENCFELSLHGQASSAMLAFAFSRPLRMEFKYRLISNRPYLCLVINTDFGGLNALKNNRYLKTLYTGDHSLTTQFIENLEKFFTLANC